ncbi:uncharacterized protein [Argopecten irradians]|uniref:uncharacterized protein n=1 Tax=Argopecten irradians TaxID=31199 RepID=UPI00371179E6
MNYSPVPATSKMLQLYVAYLASVKHFHYSTVRQYLTIVGHIHKLSGYPDPIKEDYNIILELRGVKRALGTAQIPVDAITPQVLIKIYNTLDLSQTVALSFWCACLVAFYGLLRPGNVVVHSTFNSTRDLRRIDVSPCSWGYLLRFRWTKTIQYREKVMEVLLPRISTNHVLCPARAISQLLKSTPMADPLGPLFLSSPRQALTNQEFRSCLARALRLAGLDPSNIKGHSFRRGGASWLHKQGVPVDQIKTMGHWASDAVLRYLEPNFEKHLSTMVNFGQSLEAVTVTL